ncbi:hypothetical protein RUND412_005874 [Rhizina undulata]
MAMPSFVAEIEVEQDITSTPAVNALSPSPEYSPEEPDFKITTQLPAPLFRYNGEFKATIVQKLMRERAENEIIDRTLENRTDVYVVDLNGVKHILKAYYPLHDDLHMDLFQNKSDAYASLIYHNVDEPRFIQCCFGMLEFTEPTDFT